MHVRSREALQGQRHEMENGSLNVNYVLPVLEFPPSLMALLTEACLLESRKILPLPFHQPFFLGNYNAI